MQDAEQRLKRLENQVIALKITIRVLLKVLFKVCNWTSAPGGEDLIPHIKALESLSHSATKSPR